MLVTAREVVALSPGFLDQLPQMEAKLHEGETTVDRKLPGGKVKLVGYL